MSMSRKDFMSKSAIASVGLAIAGAKTKTSYPLKEEIPHILNNVRLETEFEYDDTGEITATQTSVFSIEIQNGKILKILPKSNIEGGVDMGGVLVLPGFKDMHIHLDKTYFGEKWQAVRPRRNGVKGMIALEQKIIPELLKNSTEKAKRIIELLQSKGTVFARSHVNIEPTSKLQSLKNLEVALEAKKATFGAELVAFPQHGIYYTDSVPYMKEAAATDIDFIGGLDPQSIDSEIERTIDFTVQLALDHRKGIDIHLHETGESGIKTIDYLADKVLENPSLKDKTFLSHCFALGKLDPVKLTAIIEKLGEAEIGIISTIPFGGLVMPIPELINGGVKVYSGNDSIVDHWNTFGTGSVLQKANIAAQLYGYVNEYKLSRMLTLATAGVVPLSDEGQMQWPKVGDDATFTFVDASCSAEAVSRISKISATMYKGKLLRQDG